MKTCLECMPCFLRQAMDAMNMVELDHATRERILRQVMREAAEMDFALTPPAMAQRIHRILRNLTEKKDPYRGIKDQYNTLALSWLSPLREQVRNAECPFDAAVRLAIVGNVIDFGVAGSIAPEMIRAAVDQALTTPLDGNPMAIQEALQTAARILYLADNCGEIVFDQLLLEQLPLEKVVIAVRGFPIINDATLVDAETTGLVRLAPVISNGSDAPGTLLEDCSPEFRDEFDRADLIIAKGQGNYETLSDIARSIVFLLKAKCPAVARDLGCAVGTSVIRQNRATPVQT